MVTIDAPMSQPVELQNIQSNHYEGGKTAAAAMIKGLAGRKQSEPAASRSATHSAPTTPMWLTCMQKCFSAEMTGKCVAAMATATATATATMILTRKLGTTKNPRPKAAVGKLLFAAVRRRPEGGAYSKGYFTR